ncbi:type II secretion system minor pseudopilin GspI [Pectobacteriaceae bacterium CE70]|uniref:Type II secretion system protein I n=1 Tax=Serratia sp. (strain ATCC 39006) TaxID=104623 RepID=A0A2I5T6E9_SERS3|nr:MULTISPECIES: type II secretion system minor pseudopilin GspI [Enterobacterales]WJV61330.1 type II secretion system minor pseudopilin GspI [Pectobacteriaceae bacterium C52]WJV65658.1 type II secretion system minor pseudopilin GspI [Pectobacteriaceae bacterium CE70]WJY09679.1 type II secretion system minor pseudopilin GspI [Pectobacteriaceae bacterium C80]AUH00116.1 type II secretion system protein GspI [Serratia sp. ATCC 39006]AUH04435.1 type II secretion system protein GspI [Serratia sp. A
MKQQGMTLLEVMIALVVFALAGLTVLKTTAQQAGTLSRLEEKTFASWIADNQQVQVQLENSWPDTRWIEGEVPFAGTLWYWRLQGVETADSHVRALDVEVRHNKNSPSSDAWLRSYVVRKGEPAQ